MLVIKDQPIAFTSDGTLFVFDSREESAKWMKDREENDYEVWAEPKWLLRTLRELEKEGDDGVEKADFPSIGEFRAEQAGDGDAARQDYERQVREAVEEGEFSEATIRAIKVSEDTRQKRLLEIKDE